ncbi:MAG: tRNA (adenosine(37)-N6)-threonylcarbamoyltransferase complex dimerization subunit type 1 TsaB [Bryobacteraceae bacterium]
MTPLILAVDTTHVHGSLALARAGDLVEEVALESPSGFAHVIYSHLEALLVRHGVSVDDVACFAAASGPGAFTGVRVCLACVKGLAEAACKPAVAVSNLAAIASFGTAPRRAAMFDARRGEIYAAVYDDAGRPIGPETVESPTRWLAALPDGVELVSPDFTPFDDAVAASHLRDARRTNAPRALAAAIARIAWRRWQTGETSDPAALDANYVRRSDAELLWKG